MSYRIFCSIIDYMQKQALIKTNQYLKNPAQRRKGIVRSVSSSSAIEGIYDTITDSDVPIKAKSISRRKSSASLKSRR